MAADFKYPNEVDINAKMSGKVFDDLAKYCQISRLSVSQALEQIINAYLSLTPPSERTAEIQARHRAATEGSWWYDQDDDVWRLHGVMYRIPASDALPEQVVNKQIIKAPKQILWAPKKDERYAEYWPDKADAEFIVNSWSDIKYLLERVAVLEQRLEAANDNLAEASKELEENVKAMNALRRHRHEADEREERLRRQDKEA